VRAEKNSAVTVSPLLTTVGFGSVFYQNLSFGRLTSLHEEFSFLAQAVSYGVCACANIYVNLFIIQFQIYSRFLFGD
jgi:hypothetical protein